MKTHRVVPLLAIVLLALLLAGCNLPTAPPEHTATPSLTPTLRTPTPTLTPDWTAQLSATAVPLLTFTRSPTPTAIDPQPVTAPAPQTPAAYPAASSVLIADGRCCVGGIVGSQTEVTVSFHPAFAASEMRYRNASRCLTEAELGQTPWQPFAASISLPVSISVLNWIGLYVTAQYRDADGNVSPVVCDDISVEGMPAQTP